MTSGLHFKNTETFKAHLKGVKEQGAAVADLSLAEVSLDVMDTLQELSPKRTGNLRKTKFAFTSNWQYAPKQFLTRKHTRMTETGLVTEDISKEADRVEKNRKEAHSLYSSKAKAMSGNKRRTAFVGVAAFYARSVNEGVTNYGKLGQSYPHYMYFQRSIVRNRKTLNYALQDNLAKLSRGKKLPKKISRPLKG